MRKIFIVLFTLVVLPAYSQTATTSKLFRNGLRYYYPIGVKKETLLLTLSEGKKPYTVSSKKMALNTPSGKTINVDEVVSVQISPSSEVKFPSVLYLLSGEACTGMIYLDTFENLPMWKDILQNSEEAGDNYFICQSLIHLFFKISPADGLISIMVDLTN